MTEFLIYDLKVAVLIAVFYMFYRLMLARETFHQVNRIVLLATALASFVLPLCVITFHQTVVIDQTPSITVGELQTAVLEPETHWWETALPILFIIGVVLTLSYTLWSLYRIIRLIKHSELHPQEDGTIICVTGNAALSPFSWMHYIVMNRSDYEVGDAAILAHERGHIRLHHSWDLLLVDTLTALQWFNPAMWMLRSDLRTIHEYEADGVVLSQGINARQYQYLLITKAAGIGGYSLANGISHSTLKNRINMMLHTRSNRRSLMKLLALIPIVAIALAANAEKVIDVSYERTSEPQVMPLQIQGDDDEAFDVVEQMPEFPGGMEALFKFLTENIHYPKSALEAKIEGRVLAQFVIAKDGSVVKSKIVKSVDPALDAEALRLINAMPNWTPGKQNGKVVPVKFTVPINFSLDGGKTDNVADTNGKIFIRSNNGEASSETQPLFIVDGKEMDSKSVQSMDPKTIDRMEVLKDQATLGKYGEKGKNGVILITLKK